MKKLYILTILFFLLTRQELKSQFALLGNGDFGVFKSIEMLTPSEIFLMTDSEIHISIDGGTTFLSTQNLDTTVISPGYNANFYSSNLIVDSWQNGFVLEGNISTGFTIYRSGQINGNWAIVLETSDFATGIQLTDFKLSDNETIIAIGLDGKVFRSIDNGTSWDMQSLTNSTTSIHYLGDNTWMIGSYNGYYKSTDNGSSWSFESFDNIVNFTVSNICSHESTIIVNANSSRCFKSIDNAETWTLFHLPFIARKIYHLEGDSYLGIPNGNNIDRVYISYNGGLNWEYILLPEEIHFVDFDIYDENNMIICGYYGLVFKTSNGVGPSHPISSFDVITKCTDEYIEIENSSSYSPDYTYEWYLDDVLISNDFDLPELLSTQGAHTLTFTVNTGVEIVTSEETFVLTNPPTVPYIGLSNTDGTVCYGNTFYTTLQYQTIGAEYTRIMESGFEFSIGDNIPSNQFSFSVYGDTYFTIVGTNTNTCRTVTTTEVVNITCYKPSPSTTFFLPADTVCFNQQPYYIGVANSDPAWHYGYNTLVPNYIQGNGDTLLIPFSNSSSNSFTAYLKLLNSEAGCTMTQNVGVIKPILAQSVLNVVPEVIEVGQSLNLTYTSNYLHKYWDFGPDASPQQAYGWPVSTSIIEAGRDTVKLFEIFADSSCISNQLEIVNYVENIAPQIANLCSTSEINRSTQTIDSKLDRYGNRIFTGYFILEDGVKHLFIRKEDPFGNLIFEKTHLDESDSYGISIEIDSLNNIYLIGQVAQGTDLWGTLVEGSSFFLKLSQLGESIWNLNNSNTTFIDLIVTDNEIYTLAEHNSNNTLIYFPQTNGPDLQHIPPFGIVNNGSVILTYSLNGQIDAIYPFGSSTSNVNINQHQTIDLHTSDITRLPKMAKLDNSIVVSSICTLPALNHTYFAGDNIIDSELFNDISENNLEYLLMLFFDIETSQLTGKFELAAHELVIKDVVFLEDGIISIAEFSNLPYFDTQGYHSYIYPNSERLNSISKFDILGNVIWSRIENTSQYVSIEKSGVNEFLAVIETSGEGSLLSATNNFNFPISSLQGSLIIRQTSDGEITEILELDEPETYRVQSLCADICGNATISWINSETNNLGPLQQFNSEHQWKSSKIGSSDCSDYCSTNSPNQLIDLALIDVHLDSSVQENNETNVYLIVQNVGSETINSASLQVEMDAQMLNINYALNLEPGEISAPIEIGPFDLSGFIVHHQIGSILEVNGSLDDNIGNNTLQNSTLLCTGPLSGTYSIAASNADFSTFQQSADALKTCGISNHVTFEVQPGDYFGQLVIEQFAPSTTEYDIMWISSTDLSEDVQFHFDQIFMNHEEHVILQDSVVNITFQSISFIDSIPSQQQAIILFGNQCSQIEFNKCHFLASTLSQQILIDSPIGSSSHSIEITNNIFQNGLQAIRLGGNSQFHDQDVSINDNSFYDQSQFSINSLFNHNINITGNLFSDNTSSNIIRIKNNTGELNIDKNNFISNQDSTVYIENYIGPQSTPQTSRISNNFISRGYDSGNLSGLVLKNVSNLGVWHNTMEKSLVVDNCQRISSMNNIIGNSEVILDVRLESSDLDFDYNQYYTIGENQGLFNWLNNESFSLEAWQLQSALDIHSSILPPFFLSVFDSHIVGQFLEGNSLPWIDTDFDGDPRAQTNPIIGADEPSLIPHQIYIVELVPPSCFGFSDGQIELVALSATGESNFIWSDGFNGNIRTGLSSGIYSILSEDESGETVSLSFEIEEPEYFDIQILTDTICFTGNNGNAYFEVSPNETLQSIMWNTGQETNSISNLSIGEYWVEVISSHGCLAQDSVLFEAIPFEIIPHAISQPCANLENIGSIDIEVNGGLGNYSYTWNAGDTSQDLSNLVPGTYSVLVEDGQGCQLNFTQEIYYRMDIGFLQVSQCFDPGTGYIDAYIVGGNSEYTFSWNTGDTTLELSNLNQGLYTLTATDQTGCTVTDSIFLKESLYALTLDSIHYRCTPTDIPAVFITLDNIDALEFAQWNTGGNPYQDNTNFYSEHVSLTVIDTLGCVQTISAFIPNEPEPEIVDITNCYNGTNGFLEVVQDDYYADSLVWSTGETYSTTSVPSNGLYTVDLYYNNGCHLTESYLFDKTPLDIQISDIIHPTCWYDSGSISVEVQGGTEPLEYLWSNQSTTPSIENLDPGTYILDVWDSNFCNQEIEVQINPPLSSPFTFDIDGVSSSYLDSTHFFVGTFPDGYSIDWDVSFCDVVDEIEDTLWINFDHIGFALISGIVTDLNGCQVEEQINVFVEEYINTDEMDDFFIDAFPNPVIDQLTIQSGYSTPLHLDVIDALGNVIWTGTLYQILEIETSNWAAGSYTIRYSDAENTFKTLSIVKQ